MILSPTSEAELIEAVRAARAPLAIEGGGSKGGLGRPLQAQDTLSLKNLGGVIFYEPAEMVFRARAGTPVAQLEQMLAEHGQMLPFEPMNHQSIYGAAGAPTIGAVAACNISGPRRISHGAARDSLIGVRFVNGFGEAINSGGRVMKNVTGLDLVKLQAGAFGTLGPLSEVTFKVLPRPSTQATLALHGLDDARAIGALCRAVGSPFEISGAAHLPAGILGDAPRTLLRIENVPESVVYRLGELQKIVGGGDTLDAAQSEALWRQVRDVAAFASPDARALWRISTAPSRAVDLVRRVQQGGAVAHFYDWSGGLVWLAVETGDDARAADIRAAVAACGGHATLVRAPVDLRARVDVFQPPSAPLMALTRAVKASFDPNAILNPGRMYAGV
ncbi:MAG: glycolate oxidase subunit GlcE [Hyphomicrobiales bacterium]|nr:glycolate oxidase subunit GlcE [Hyphomicrobiales bacterium]